MAPWCSARNCTKLESDHFSWLACPAAPTMQQFDAPCEPEHCHVETRMDYFCRLICFLQNQEGFLTIFWHNCPHSRFHQEWPDRQHCGSQWTPHNITETIRFLLTMRRHSGIYLSPAVLHTLTTSHHNMQGWTSIHRRKVSRTSCLLLTN